MCNEIEKQVLDKITPSLSYRKNLEEAVNEIDEKIKKEIKKKNLPATVELVGSIAKDTYLKDNMDIDFFICFPADFSKEEIAKNASLIGKKLLVRTEESYAEHPYIRGYYKRYYVEIVPCYKIENANQKLSAVDRTPLHTKFVTENLKEKQKSEVRLFKQFLEGISCYGAEAQVEGFSGYLCEIIILFYGSFEKTIQKATKWKKGENFCLGKGNRPNFDTPLVFIDPVDYNRNVASALSEEKFNLFIKACKEYEKKPQITYFFPNPIKPWTIEKIKKNIDKQNSKYVGISFKKPDIIDENLYPQIRKSIKAIKEECQRNDFVINGTDHFIDEKNIYLVIKTKKEKLSESYVHMGPPVKIKKNREEFIKKWEKSSLLIKKPYEKDGRLYVKIKRDYTAVELFLKDKIKNLSMGKHIDRIIGKKYEILKLDDLLNDKFRIFWTKHLDDKKSWQR